MKQETDYIPLGEGARVFYASRDVGEPYIELHRAKPEKCLDGFYHEARSGDYVGLIGPHIAELWGIPVPDEGQCIQVIGRFEVLSQRSCSSAEKEVSP